MENKNTILYVIIAILVAVVGLAVFRNIQSKNSKPEIPEKPETPVVQKGSISGTIEYSGIKPQTGKEGFVYIEYRNHNEGEFKKLEGYTIPLQDNAEWKVDGVQVGKVFDARAVIQLNSGEILTRSNTITVTAPAQGEIFEFNVTLDMIPDYVLDSTAVSLGGYVTINGYIPGGSTLSVFTKELTQANFSEVVRNTPVTGSTTDWIWENAKAGTMYQIKVEAYDSKGALFASSNVGEKAAPSDNAYFVITSRATDPSATPAKAPISGTVKVNGEFSDESQVNIKARKVGESEYKTVTVVEPSNSPVSWAWNDSVSGVEYDIKAFLLETGKEDIEGTKTTVMAPATDLPLTIDTQYSPDAPDDEPELVSCSSTSDGKYNANLKFQNIDGAAKYKLQVGKSEGSSDVNDSIVNNSGDADPTLVATINKDQDYYTRYAYSECKDCGTSSYSEFSDSLKFSCPE